MSMILLEPAYKILHTPVKFKRRTISVTPFFIHFVSDGLGIPAWLGDVDNDERDAILLGYGGRLPAADL
jgi:hypothetical protein